MDMVGAQGEQQGVEKLQREMQRRNLTAVLSIIGDFMKKEALELDHFRKTYKTTKVDDGTVAVTPPNLVKQFRNVKPEDAEQVGEELQGGRKIDVYIVKHVELMGIQAELSGEEGQRMTVWVDHETKLPVRILLEASFDVEGKSRDWFDFSRFAWNEPLEPDLFSLEAPDGYTVVEANDIQLNLNKFWHTRAKTDQTRM